MNEAEIIESCLDKLQYLRKIGHEVIVVDGGSIDKTVVLAQPLADQLLISNPGRAIQMNMGARVSNGQYLLFLHADTGLPDNVNDVFGQLEGTINVWGRFDVQLTGKSILFRIIETMMNLRSRLTGIVTGDQVIFIDKALFEKIGGYPEIELMEDIAISKILKKISYPVCFREKVMSSSRRWENNGIIKTVLKMWLLRILYFFNFQPRLLAKFY